MEILNKYKRWNDILTSDRSEYYDIVLTQDNSPSVGSGIAERCLVSFIDCGDAECIGKDEIVSKREYKWDGSINENVILENIGFTGIDNGTIEYDVNTMTNEKFLNILTGSTLSTENDDFRLHLHKVTGNTATYDYTSEYKDGYFALKGGFFQGFYKLFGFDYQILPQFIENSWNMEFELRPQDYEIAENTLNKTHSGNDGIFFYMGTRAENKFSFFYNDEKENKSECEEKDSYGGEGYFIENKEEDYLAEDICITGSMIETSEGGIISDKSGKKILTDNKYLFINRTKTGFTVDTWNQCDNVELEIKNKIFKKAIPVGDCENKVIVTDNKYLYMNRTKTGVTVDDLENGVMEEEKQKYDRKNDLLGNAFALRINENGEIGYSYLIKDCDDEKGYKLMEEFGTDNEKTGFVSYKLKKGEWYTINVRFRILDGSIDRCGKSDGKRKMRIYIYINGYLKFISKILPEFNFRELDDDKEKQEGVPFNISLGGGTQGLGDSVWLNYREIFAPNEILEKSFAGTFIGDIRSFKFYACPLEYMEVKNNFLENTYATYE